MDAGCGDSVDPAARYSDRYGVSRGGGWGNQMGLGKCDGGSGVSQTLSGLPVDPDQLAVMLPVVVGSCLDGVGFVKKTTILVRCSGRFWLRIVLTTQRCGSGWSVDGASWWGSALVLWAAVTKMSHLVASKAPRSRPLRLDW